jgi:hypothetical protein
MAGTYIHSGAFEEESGLVGDQVSGEVLRCVDQACDESSAEIGAFPEVEERRATAGVGLDLDCTFHHSEGLVGVSLVVVAKAFDRTHCLLLATTTKQPPGRLGCEE